MIVMRGDACDDDGQQQRGRSLRGGGPGAARACRQNLVSTLAPMVQRPHGQRVDHREEADAEDETGEGTRSKAPLSAEGGVLPFRSLVGDSWLPAWSGAC